MSVKKMMVYGIVVLSMVFWSMTYIWYKVVFEQLNPISIMTFRLTFSAFFLLLFSKLIRRLQIPTRTDFLWLVLLSVFQPFFYFLAESYGIKLVSPTIAAVIISTIPVFTPFAAYLFYRDKISIFNFLGIVVSFTGVLMVVLGRDLHFSGSVLGIFLLFMAVCSALVYSVIIVKLSHKYNSFTIISWQNLMGAIFFLPLFFIFEYHQVVHLHILPKIWLNLIYLAVFGSSVAYVFFTYSIKNLGVTRASMFTNVIPVFTAIFSFFVLGETLEGLKIIGIMVVLLGLFMAQFPKK